jgi:hypothetical protein
VECTQNFVGEDDKSRGFVTVNVRLDGNVEMFGFIWLRIASSGELLSAR